MTRWSTHYTNKKKKIVRTHEKKAPIEGRGTPEDLSQSIKDPRRPSWRLDYDIQLFLLSPIVEEADGSKTQTMAKVEELGNDNIQENSRKKMNSTSVVRILWVPHIFSCLSTKLKWYNIFNRESTIS